jgi:hypothetical protein
MNAPRTAFVNAPLGKLTLLFFALAIVLGLLGLREKLRATTYASELAVAGSTAPLLARSSERPLPPPQRQSPLTPAERTINPARREEARRAVQQRINFLVVDEKFGFILDDPLFATANVARELRALLEERANAIRAAGGPAAPKDAGALVEMRIRTLLGADYTHFQELDRVAGSMFIVTSALGVDMAHADQALTPAQELDLAKAMTAVGMAYEGETYARRLTEPVDATTGLLPMNRELVAIAQEFLSPAQIEVIRKYQEEQRAAVALGGKFPSFR